jgi:hypothetical protein
MINLKTALGLSAIGFIGHMIMARSMDIGNFIRSTWNNERGEGETGEVKFTPEQQKHIDNIIAGKTAEYHQKLTPLQKQLDELGKFKSEYEKSQEVKTQQELENAKKYDEAKKGYETKITELSTKLTEREQAIQDRDIRFELTSEINKQGGFTDETLAMVRANAFIDTDGKVKIKSTDANGVAVNVPVADGIKKFLTERPHLVKSSHKGGSGSGGQGDGGSGGGNGSGDGQGDDLATLNIKLAQAMKGTDLKLRSELRGKIKSAMATKGVHR